MVSNIFNLGPVAFEAIGDRILIQEDNFASGYECKTCKGSGKQPCSGCGGSGMSGVVAGARCSQCEGAKELTCADCKGLGGLLIVPEVTQRRPTSGTIVSAGPKVVSLKIGDSVLYSNFAGYVVDLETEEGAVVLRILHETEILARMEGKLELRTLKGKSEIATFQP